MEYIDRVAVGCSGNAWEGFVCDSVIPEIVKDTASLGDIFSLVVIILAVCFCLIFWLSTYKIDRDLTKTFMMPVVAPFTFLLPMELVHSTMLLTGRNHSEFLLTLIEGEKYLNNVAHLTILYCTTFYMLQISAVAKMGTTHLSGRQIDEHYSYNALYVLFLSVFTVLCAGLHPIFSDKFREFISQILSVASVGGYFGCVALFLCAVVVFCCCSRPVAEPISHGESSYAGYSRLGGTLFFTQITLLGPLLKGCLMLSLDPPIHSFLTNIYILLRFFLPLTVLVCTFLFLTAYRDAFALLCSPENCRYSERQLNEPIREAQYNGDPAPRTGGRGNQEVRATPRYQARVENVEV